MHRHCHQTTSWAWTCQAWRHGQRLACGNAFATPVECVACKSHKLGKGLITFSIPSCNSFSCERFFVGLPARASITPIWELLINFYKKHENWNGVKSQRNGVKSQRNGVIFLRWFFKRDVQLELGGWSLNWHCSQFMRQKHGCELQSWKDCSSHHACSFPTGYLHATLPCEGFSFHHNLV